MSVRGVRDVQGRSGLPQGDERHDLEVNESQTPRAGENPNSAPGSRA
jgi:hypothetical protein